MKTRLFFARAMTLALVAGGIVASLPTEAMAATRTWTNGAIGATNKGKWGTGTAFASNWLGSTNPVAADTALFLGNNGNTGPVAVQNANQPIAKLVFNSGTTAYSFTNQALLIGGDGSIPNIGISNSSGREQTFENVRVGAPVLHLNSSGAGSSLQLGIVDIQGHYLAVGGDSDVSELTGAAGSTYEAKSGGTQSIRFASSNGVSNLKVNGTVTTSGNTSGVALDIQGGTYSGQVPSFKSVSITSGSLNLSDNTFSVLTLEDTAGASYNQGEGGITKLDVGYDGTSSLNSSVATQPGAGFTLGGSLLLDGLLMPGNSLPIGTTWSLFQGVNFTAGSLSAPNAASNFSQLVLADAGSSSPYAGAFTQFGQEWYSPRATDGTYLVFQAATGNLVVVPEPSTIVFAGLGVAMSGWTMWKKRRLSKLLAAKVG